MLIRLLSSRMGVAGLLAGLGSLIGCSSNKCAGCCGTIYKASGGIFRLADAGADGSGA